MSLKLEHTPGPWQSVQHDIFTNGERIAQVWSCKYEADAHLIAAAPELLEALIICVVDAELDLTKKERLSRIEFAKKAISKARGGN